RRPGGRNGQGQLGEGTDLGAFVELGERVAARRGHPILVGERRQEGGQGREPPGEPRGRGRPVTYRRQQLISASCTGSGIRVRRLAGRIGQARERRDEGQGGELAGRLLAHASSRLSGD